MPADQPKWGDPLDSITLARQAELRALHDHRVAWSKQDRLDP
jgi:hypothetical protein